MTISTCPTWATRLPTRARTARRRIPAAASRLSRRRCARQWTSPPVYDVPVNISAVLGKAHVDVNSLLQLTSGSVLELDRKVGEAIDIYVNNRLVARGEVVVVEDRLGVTMTEIIKDGDTG